MRNRLEILDNYLDRAVAENLNIVKVLAHIFSEQAKSKRGQTYEKQIQKFPIKKALGDFDFSFQPSIDKRQSNGYSNARMADRDNNFSVLQSGSPWIV